MRPQNSTGHIKLNNNLRLILRKAGCRFGDMNDLTKIIINNTKNTTTYAVSMNDILAMVLAVEDEIIRMERSDLDKKILFELYRIRYECVNRCLKYIMDNHEIAATSFGKALLSYIGIHINKREKDALRLDGIEEVCVPSNITDTAATISSSKYRVFLNYAIEHFKFENNANNSISINEDIPESNSLEFTVFYDEPVERKDPRPISSLYRRIKIDFNKINFNTIPLIENSNKTMLLESNKLFNKLLSVFNDRSSHLSSADIKAKMKLISVMNNDRSKSDFAKKIKETNGILVMRYHEDLYRMEHKMNECMLNHDYMFPEWAEKWRKLSRYAHTSPEYFPLFIMNIKIIDAYIDLFRHEIILNENIDCLTKAKNFLRLISYKEAVHYEREVIVEAMLARLELLGSDVVMSVVSNNAKEKLYYSNIIHSSYVELMQLLGRNTPKIEDKFKRLNISIDEINKFIEIISEYGSSKQQNRLKALAPMLGSFDSLMTVPAISVNDYDMYEDAAKEYQIHLAEGIINYRELELYDRPVDTLLVNKIKQMMTLVKMACDLFHNDGDKSALSDNQIMILCAIDAVDAAHPEYLVDMLGSKWTEFTPRSRQLFRELFIYKFYPNIQYKDLLIRVLDGRESQSFHVLRVYINMIDLLNKMNMEYGGKYILEMLNSSQVTFDQSKFKSLQVLMEYYRWLKEEVRMDVLDLERLSKRINSPTDISKYNDVIGEIHLYNANNIEGAYAHILHELNKPVDQPPKQIFVEKREIPERRMDVISFQQRSISGLIKAALVLFIIVISVLVFYTL